FLDLDWLFDDDAVRTQPRPGACRHVNDRAIPDITDIGLRVHRKWRFFPRFELAFRHRDECPLSRRVVWKRTGEGAGVSFAPKPVLHQVHPFDQRISFKLRSEQVVQFGEGRLKLRMVIARFAKLARTLSWDAPDINERYTVAQKFGQGNLFRLERIVGELDSECDPKVIGLGGIECKWPDWMKIKASRSGLYVAPIAADVEHVNER